MDPIIYEIRQALGQHLYYAAIMLSLQIPDVCAALESSDGRTSNQAYKQWFRLWFQPKYPELSEDDMYCLRCGVFHQGRLSDQPSNVQYERIVFTLAAANRTTIFRSVLKKAFFTDAHLFCRHMITSAEEWYAAKQNDPNVEKNLLSLIQYRTEGLKPYIVGVPVVA